VAKLLSKTWQYKLPKKKLKRKPRQLKQYAKELNANLPNSERWFLEHYTPHPKDRFNRPFGPYIPDIINKQYRYIIEIDGSIHDAPQVKLRDVIKTKYYQDNFFKVFRVKAYNQDSLDTFFDEYHAYLARLTT
jgi:very-short-patch-repair endonuclease